MKFYTELCRALYKISKRYENWNMSYDRRQFMRFQHKIRFSGILVWNVVFNDRRQNFIPVWELLIHHRWMRTHQRIQSVRTSFAFVYSWLVSWHLVHIKAHNSKFNLIFDTLLTHWGLARQAWVSIGLSNDLTPVAWTNADFLLIAAEGTIFFVSWI